MLEVTDDKLLPKADASACKVEHAPHISREAQLVKLADKICNLRDIATSPPAKWPAGTSQRILRLGQEVIDRLRGAHPMCRRRRLIRPGNNALASPPRRTPYAPRRPGSPSAPRQHWQGNTDGTPAPCAVGGSQPSSPTYRTNGITPAMPSPWEYPACGQHHRWTLIRELLDRARPAYRATPVSRPGRRPAPGTPMSCMAAEAGHRKFKSAGPSSPASTPEGVSP